jgi:hypothetical protein
VGKKRFGGISEQSKAGQHRRADADALFEKQRWRGAMYLAGYAIECLIKAKLMKMFKQSDLEGLEAELKRRHIIPDDSSLFDHRIELYVGGVRQARCPEEQPGPLAVLQRREPMDSFVAI